MNWVTLYGLLKKKITEAIGLTNRFVDSLPDTGESGVLYFVDKDDPQDPDQYYMYVWDPDDSEFVLLDPDMDLSIYAKIADLANVATSGSYTDLTSTPDLSQYLTKTEGDASYVSYDNYNDKEVTGNPAIFRSVNGGRVKKAEVAFSPKQSGTGDPSPENIRPISGWDELNLFSGNGENLYSNANIEPYNRNNVNVTVETNSLRIKSKYNSTYQASKQLLSEYNLETGKEYILLASANVTSGVPYVAVRNSNGGIISTLLISNNNIVSCKFTMNENADNISFFCTFSENESGDITYSDFVLCEYNETHTATFDEPIAGGSHDFVSGKLMKSYITITFDGTEEEWGKAGTDGTNTRYYIPLIDEVKSGDVGICNYLIRSAGNTGEWGTYNIGANSFIVKDKDNNFQDLEAFKTYLGTNNLQLCYELATPQEITLTPEDVNLDIGLNVLTTNGDTVNLIAVPVAKELPAVTSSDEGKVLTVDSNGNWVAAESEATTALQQQY